MIAFLLVGTVWFWMILALLIVGEILYAISDRIRAGTWFVGVLLTTLFVLSGAISFTWIAANPWMLLLYIAIYIGAGLLWSMKEWYSFVKAKVVRYRQSDYYSNKTETEFRALMTSELQLDRYWGNITTWIVYFPFFMLAWVLTDPIKKIAEQFSVIYNKITSSLVNKATNKILTENKNAKDRRNS